MLDESRLAAYIDHNYGRILEANCYFLIRLIVSGR